MTILLNVEPKTIPISWNEFSELSPPNSIALDGYVYGPPKYEHERPRITFNHHEQVDRLATRATCAQVLMAIRQGLFSTFLNDATHKVNIYANDCDEDVCTSIYLLRHGRQAQNVLNEKINDLVASEDALDSTAGAYPYPKTLRKLKELAWIFQPYRDFRISGKIDKKNENEFLTIIDQVETRILKYVQGNSKQLEIDCRYDILFKQDKFAAIKEVGSHAKTGLLSDGFQSYMTVRDRGNNYWTYTLGKIAFAHFDLLGALNALNKYEGATNDQWGGANIVGGSPRVNGSSLDPETVFKVIKPFI